VLSETRFNAMLNSMGQVVSWRRAHECPCRDARSGAADFKCPICKGKGVYWELPSPPYFSKPYFGSEYFGPSYFGCSSKCGAGTGIAAIAGQKVQNEWAKLGEYEAGDQVMTLPSDSPLYDIGQNDRLIMTQSSVPFSQVFLHDGSDRIDFRVVSILAVYWRDGSSLVNGGIPEVKIDGSLSWTEREPPNGVRYTITGRRRPEFFIFREMPQDRAHYGGQRLPRRVVARRMDLFGRN
jgi:hypothetical protein